MSRALSCAGLLAAASDGLGPALAISRRSYSTAPQGAAKGRNFGAAAPKGPVRGEEKVTKKEEKDSSSSWLPDPVTGCYKPANRVEDVDVAELRNVILNQKH